MADSHRHPIIANGEVYIEPLIRKPRPNSHKFPHEYYEAKSRLWNDIDRIQQSIASSEEVFVEDKILCVRLEEKYEAKSYTPSSIVADTSMCLVGGRKYVIDPDTKGKLYFVRAKDSDLAKFKNNLSSTRKDGNQSWKNQICTIRTIDLLQPKEKAFGFDEQWTEGEVEVVIHPLGINYQDAINGFFNTTGMVNGIAVGAYSYTPLGERTVASYSCVGPGREGGKIKPDLLEFGGSVNRLFIAVMNQGNLTGAEQGTSFSAPVVAGKIGKLMAASEKIIPHLARTILIHHAESETLEGTNKEGFGYCPDDVETLLECDDNSVTILYSGEIMAGSSVKLPVYMPEVNKHKGTAKIKWTISSVVNPNMKDSDAYTNNCIEDTFYPHEMTFNFSKYGSATKKINLMDKSKYEEVQRLMDDGYSKSDLPASRPAKKSFCEADLRNSDFKWDTIIRKFVSMRTSSLLNPFLSLHAIGRDEGLHEKVRYNVVITIDVPKYDGSLYDSILQKYRNLSPIKVQNVNRIQVTNK